MNILFIVCMEEDEATANARQVKEETIHQLEDELAQLVESDGPDNIRWWYRLHAIVRRRKEEIEKQKWYNRCERGIDAMNKKLTQRFGEDLACGIRITLLCWSFSFFFFFFVSVVVSSAPSI